MNDHKIIFLANKEFKRNPNLDWFIQQVGEEAVETYYFVWNRNPEALVQELRLRWVMIRLAETNWSIKRIAREVNISEIDLRREFEDHLQQSPELYRDFWKFLND